MLSYITLKNFKSFSNIMFDLRGKGGIPKNLAFIYGENGAGKTNLMSAFLFLNKTIETIHSQARVKQLVAEIRSQTGEKEMDPSVKNEIVEHLMKSQLFDLADLIQKHRTLNSEGALEVEIGFYLDGAEGSYTLSFDATRVIYEKLRYRIIERTGTIFELSEGNSKMSPTVFFDNAYNRELEDNIEKYWGKHTFMSILNNETFTKNRKFIESRVHKNILDVLNWFQRFSVSCKSAPLGTGKYATPYRFLLELESGVIKSRDDRELLAFEKGLNDFFTSLYSDVKKVYYKIEPHEDEFRYALYFKKLLNGKILDIPFKIESTGTKKLLDIFPFVFSALSGTTVFIDEIDSGIHDLLMREIIGLLDEALDSSQKGQLIATTHSTLLMELLEKENVYILSSDVDGNKDILSVDKYEFRTQKTHSIQSRYLNGYYAGVPIAGYFDFSEMVGDVLDSLKNDEEFFEEG